MLVGPAIVVCRRSKGRQFPQSRFLPTVESIIPKLLSAILAAGHFLFCRLEVRLRRSLVCFLPKRLGQKEAEKRGKSMLELLARREIARSITRFRALQPSPELQDFVATIPRKRNEVRSRRRSPRRPLIANVTVVPLDAGFCPIGPPFIACTRNVSTGGICLYHQSRAPSAFLYLEIEAIDSPPTQAVMKVLRQTRVGRFWEIAGRTREANGDPTAASP
jgi:hypothetical protein